ncbi:zinc-binding dehydrogenase [Arthrobacter sp. I2-34]|uniref:Zinc-binding dehydrogenase n=1 Tax=Arthrobacter hankyongi TaxID=2904801 RepID=A0ABS9L3V2_9MICC|nr:zinc-binding dehydrogenase [Arthrobacter hankyongi]MCG2621324.1 zinc-binding dehydrogenase [Arthrobacter hankyongi]
MKAAVVNAIGGGFELDEVELANPAGREVLIEVKASGLCHTDLTYAKTGLGYPAPCVLGHEVAGVVVAAGPEATGLAIGDHVVGCLVQYCGACRKCLSGRPYQCLNREATLRAESQPPRISRSGEAVAQGFGLGGFAERALIHENQLVKVPDTVPFPQAALLGCGAVTGAGAVLNTAGVQPGDAVVVIGAGGVGLNAVTGAVLAGATTIIAVDLTDEKLKKAREFGATDVINSSVQDPVAAVLEITGTGADAVFDFVGAPEVTGQGLQMTAPGGGLYLIGASSLTGEFTVNTIQTIGTQRRIQGVFMGSTNPKRDIALYADLYLAGRFNLDGLLSKEISLSEVNDGYAALEDGSTARVVITRF